MLYDLLNVRYVQVFSGLRAFAMTHKNWPLSLFVLFLSLAPVINNIVSLYSMELVVFIHDGISTGTVQLWPERDTRTRRHRLLLVQWTTVYCKVGRTVCPPSLMFHAMS